MIKKKERNLHLRPNITWHFHFHAPKTCFHDTFCDIPQHWYVWKTTLWEHQNLLTGFNWLFFHYQFCCGKSKYSLGQGNAACCLHFSHASNYVLRLFRLISHLWDNMLYLRRFLSFFLFDLANMCTALLIVLLSLIYFLFGPSSFVKAADVQQWSCYRQHEDV